MRVISKRSQKRVEFFSCCLKKSSQKRVQIELWNHVVKKVQFVESCSQNLFNKKNQFFESYSKKKVQFLWVTVEKKGTILYESYWKNKISLSHVEKTRVQFCESCYIKSSILWVILKRRVQFSSHLKEFFGSCCKKVQFVGSILWVTLRKKVQFFESC